MSCRTICISRFSAFSIKILTFPRCRIARRHAVRAHGSRHAPFSLRKALSLCRNKARINIAFTLMGQHGFG
jgi:hypothetical protein